MSTGNFGTEINNLSNNIKVPRIGVSSCLMGNNVRFDGGHKNNRFITVSLNDKFDLVPICPEVAIGLGVPREPIRLIKTEDSIHARGVRNEKLDVTDDLKQYAGDIGPLLATLSGFIFKMGSPSCGLSRVKIYDLQGLLSQPGQGIFSEALSRAYPNMPVEEEGRLNNPELKDNFLQRVFIYNDWITRLHDGLTINSLEEFHRTYKFTLLAHDQARYRMLGRHVAQSSATDINNAGEYYISEFMKALKNITTPKTHTNTLLHIMGFLKHQIESSDKEELLQAIHNYHHGHIPRAVPLTLIGHHLRRHPDKYLSSQHYLKYPLPI